MKITEKPITEAQLKEMTDLILDEEAKTGLDIHDLECVLRGKEGVLYEGLNDEGEANALFMRRFFDELIHKEEVRKCSFLLVNIGMAAESPLMMDDMNALHEFFESFDNDDMEMKWGIKTNSEGLGMSMLVICTHYI